MVVNVVGCFLAGLFFYLLEERFAVNETVRAAMLVGVLGGFTTFSSFGWQTFALARDGQPGLAMLYVAASNVLGLLLVWVGYVAARVAWGGGGV